MERRSVLGGIAALTMFGATGATASARRIPDYNLPEEMRPRMVRIKKGFTPYELHIDPGQFALYWTLPEQQAIRYTVGVGRTGLYEAGEFYVGQKKEWPSWTPTPDMIKRNPGQYAQFANGMPGGLKNPLGARALYLFTPARGDTYLRVHGTDDPSTLGRRVSNGCARLVNDQMADLYERVPINSRVVLHPMQG